MGLFKKKKSKKKTFRNLFDEKLKEANKAHDNYIKLTKRIPKLLDKYNTCFFEQVYFHTDKVSLYLKSKFYNEFPDGFFAYADKLGLNIVPMCNSGYYDFDNHPTKGIEVSAKSK